METSRSRKTDLCFMDNYQKCRFYGQLSEIPVLNVVIRIKTLNNCKFSETFNYRNQKKCIISDKHTRKYIKSTNFEKKLYEFNTWG